MSRPMKRLTTKTWTMFISLLLKLLIWKRPSQLIHRWITLSGLEEIKTLLYPFELIFFVLRFFAVSCVTHNLKNVLVSLFPLFFLDLPPSSFYSCYSRSTISYVKFYFVVLFFFFLLRFKTQTVKFEIVTKDNS